MGIVIEKILTSSNIQTTTTSTGNSKFLDELEENHINIEDEKDAQQIENHNVVKKKLLETLLRRVYDKNAYSRSETMEILCDLCEKNCIPQEFLQDVL